jgi:acyl-coenzyme A synthetase/AMP-(fatty) acid ligase
MNGVAKQPLCAARDANRPIAYTPQGPVSVGQFVADVLQLMPLLPREAAVLNVCQDRYRFLVGLMATLTLGRVSLLPTSHTPEMVRELINFTPDIVCLHDGSASDIALGLIAYPDKPGTPSADLEMPWIEESRVVAYLFTSGSTGKPVAHCKTWGCLVRDARAAAARLGLADSGYTMVGTVPAQHMYGFESTVLISLHGGCATWSGRPFYPADIAATLARVPRPRALVTTPFHLQSLISSGVEAPALDMILSATAPLSPILAREAEARLGAPLYEIFGSTETGQIASRRTIESPLWTLLPEVHLIHEGGRTYAEGGHVQQRYVLADVIESPNAREFLLHGRSTDMINIAGKRTSLGYLNHHLNSIAHVEDGSFFCPSAMAGASVERLCAFVVAPRLTPAQLLSELRQRIEPVFLPRPLLFLERLPRNDTGKLPTADLQNLLDNYRNGLAPPLPGGQS